MVLVRRDHRRAPFSTRRHDGVGGFAMGCACCEPSARREVIEWSTPLPLPSKMAFLMGASNTSAPRLAEGVVGSMRQLPREVRSYPFLRMSWRRHCRKLQLTG